ncbi:sulfatase-like hydrolase/transferase [Akkermansiaceae bacterium]|nr:sulfatase-like hydrolase/transferase [Akkermansiaceae bacterium]
MKDKLLIFTLSFTATIAGFSPLSLNAEESRPDVVFIMTDDQGYPVMGAHGHPWIRTPHLDKVYEKSVRFDRFMMGSTCAL